MSARFFISYRRGDSAGHAGRLSDALEQRFGADAVFQDIKDVAPGDDFMRDLDRALTSCAAMLVVIGPTWATATENGQPRLFNESDLVRTEIATALLRSDVLVVPVLVNGATMPRIEQLPEPLRPLATRQAIELSDARWSYDVGRLSARLEGELDLSSPPTKQSSPNRQAPIMIVVGIVVVAIVALATLLLLRPGDSSGDTSNGDEPASQPSTDDSGSSSDDGGPSTRPSSTTPVNIDDVLGAGEMLEPGDALRSPNERFVMRMQADDGNLVVYDETRPDGDQDIWEAGTHGNPGAYAVMQPDGNFLIYRSGPPSNAADGVYETQTSGNPGATLTLKDSGDFVVTSADGEELFNSATE